MANFLTTLLQGLAGQQAPTELEGVTVTPRKKVPPIGVAQPQTLPARNPFTADYIQAAQQAAQAQGQLPRVSGGTDAGLYGLLPPKVRNGRLRDILGAVGDGLLMRVGKDPLYQPRVDQRREGQALIGYDQDPNAAIERMAQTGAPGSVDDAVKLLTANQTSQDRAAQRDLTKAYHDAQIGNRNAVVLQKAAQFIPGMLRNVHDAADYNEVYGRLTNLARRFDPEATPTTAWGLPDPADWDPSMTELFGTTGGQLLNADVGRERIQQSDVNNRRSTSTSSANNQRTVAQSNTNNMRSTGQSNTNSVRASTDRQAALAARKGSGGGSGLHAKTTGATAAPKQAAGRLTPTQAMKLPKGTVFVGTDGRKYTR